MADTLFFDDGKPYIIVKSDKDNFLSFYKTYKMIKGDDGSNVISNVDGAKLINRIRSQFPMAVRDRRMGKIDEGDDALSPSKKKKSQVSTNEREIVLGDKEKVFFIFNKFLERN